jgi:hypothetical protein
MSIDPIRSFVNFPVNWTTSAKTATTDTTTSNNNSDCVSISSGAARMDLLSNFMDGAGNDGVITLDEMRAFRDKQIALVQNIVGDTLKTFNIKSSDQLQIDIDPHNNNNVVVTGSTDENNNAIAAALQEDDEFRNAFKAASGAATLVAAVEASMPFQEAYSSDPKAAVAQYSWLIGREWDFNMYFKDGNVDYSVI